MVFQRPLKVKVSFGICRADVPGPPHIPKFTHIQIPQSILESADVKSQFTTYTGFGYHKYYTFNLHLVMEVQITYTKG